MVSQTRRKIMNKKKKENFVNEFEEEEREEFGELLSAGDALEELESNAVEAQDFGRVKVSVVRAYLYIREDPLSRTTAALSFGNLLTLVASPDYSNKFFKVKVPRTGKALEGFVLKTKVKKI